MRISSLTLRNFGIYAGKHTLNLDSKKPVILIGGMNGRGKTTILEAVLFALYGRRSFAVRESGLPFPKYLRQRVNSKDGNGSASVDLEFIVSDKNEKITYRVVREWSSKAENPSIKTTVYKDGTHDLKISENWDYFIEEMLPCAIAPFFFFDGEKVSELASTDDDTYITEAIKSLLGINVIDTAINDMQRLIAAKQKSIKNNAAISFFNEFDVEIEEIDKVLKLAKEQAGLLDTTRIQLENKLQTAEDKFSAMGGTFALNREKMLGQKKALDEELANLNAQLLDIVAGDLPLLMVVPLLEEILVTATDEKKQRNMEATLEQLPELLRGYEKQKHISLNSDDFMQYVREHTNNMESIYNLTDAGFSRLQSLCAFLPEKQQSAISVISKRNRLYEEMEDVDKYLSINVSEEEVNSAYQAILNLTAELATTKEQLRMARESESAHKSKYEEFERKKARAIEKAVESMEGMDDEKRMLMYARRSINVLLEYRTRLQSQKTSHLAITMTGCFKQLASKQRLISEIQIDEESLSVHYYSGDGNEVDYASFSAGEKQLLVIAMLWALGKCSKKKFPVIVDTPLARLDSVHRKALVKNYFPKASEQVVLLSTDEEVYGSLYQQLFPHIGKEYTLKYDEKIDEAVVEQGYFGGKVK